MQRAADDQVDAFAVDLGRVVQIGQKSQLAADQLIGVAFGGFGLEIHITATLGVVHLRTKPPQHGFGAKPPRCCAAALCSSLIWAGLSRMLKTVQWRRAVASPRAAPRWRRIGTWG